MTNSECCQETNSRELGNQLKEILCLKKVFYDRRIVQIVEKPQKTVDNLLI